MLILTIRTDKPEAELGLFDSDKQLDYITWLADRQLAETIHLKIKELLDSQHADLNNLQGIVVYQGSGSFTGLRIGLSVANTLANALAIPIIGATGVDWLKEGCEKIGWGNNQKIIIPEYGSPPNVTKPRK